MKAARAAWWLTDADYATLRLARHLARQLDRLEDQRAVNHQQQLLTIEDDDHDRAGRVTYVAATLLSYLRELRLTVAARGLTSDTDDDDPIARIKARLHGADSTDRS